MECTINQKQEDDMIPHVWFSPHVAIIYDVVLPVKFIVLNIIFITSWWEIHYLLFLGMQISYNYIDSTFVFNNISTSFMLRVFTVNYCKAWAPLIK